MKVEQIYTLVNSTVKEVLGDTAVVNEDLTNIVDIGKTVIDTDNLDSYVKKLVNHIGKVIFVNRAYAGNVPSVLMDAWEFGSICEKISADLPEAEENSSWNLVDGTDYSPNKFYQPKVEAKFFNNRITFEIPVSFTEKQVKESFSNVEQLNAFVSMLQTNVEKAMTVRLDNLIMRTINNFTATTLATDLGSTPDMANTSVKAVNLLKLYNEKYPDKVLTKATCLQNPDFIRYASFVLNLYKTRMSKISKLFNIDKKERFTPADMLHCVLLADFASASKVFLQSDTFNKDMVTLPKYEEVPYWQGSGQAYAFTDVSALDVTTGGNTVKVDGILGVMFDRDSLGVSNLSRRVTSNYNAKAEFYTNFYKMEAGYFNDTSENFVVFFIGEGGSPAALKTAKSKAVEAPAK